MHVNVNTSLSTGAVAMTCDGESSATPLSHVCQLSYCQAYIICIDGGRLSRASQDSSTQLAARSTRPGGPFAFGDDLRALRINHCCPHWGLQSTVTSIPGVAWAKGPFSRLPLDPSPRYLRSSPDGPRYSTGPKYTRDADGTLSPYL